MEPEGSLPYSQAPATCPYPEMQLRFVILVADRSDLTAVDEGIYSKIY